jgi:hypothetical protein
MFKRKKREQYLNSYFKPTTSMKINKIINEAIPSPDKPSPGKPSQPKNSGISDSEGLSRAYNAPNAIFVDGNKMYVAGTRSLQEAITDWPRIGTWQTGHINRFGQVVFALNDNPQVDTLIGHSLGASTVAEMQRQTNNKYMARYYGAPFLNINPFDAPDPRNQTFRHPGDPVSALDHKAVDVPSDNFHGWWWAHAYDGFPDDRLPKSYKNDFPLPKDLMRPGAVPEEEYESTPDDVLQKN